MSGILRVFDPESTHEETRRLSRLAQKCWSPLTIVYNPLKAGSIDSTDVVPHDKAIIRAQNADFVPSKRIQGRPECTIFVGNLSAKTTASSLEEEFGRYGRIVKATVIEDIITGRSRGYGFVEYSIEGEALKAYECSNRTWLDGNKIFVDMECGRLLPGWVPRRLGGGFNGRKESGQLRFGCRERPFKKPIKLLTEREINRFFNDILGRKAQNAEKKDVNPKVIGSEEDDTGNDGRREVRDDIPGVEDSEIEGEKEEKLKHEHNERKRYREHRKKKRHSRSDDNDEVGERRRIHEKRDVDPNLICIKEESVEEGITDDEDAELKFDSCGVEDFEVYGEGKETFRREPKDRRKHRKEGRYTRSDEYEVDERRRPYEKRDVDPNLILIKDEPLEEGTTSGRSGELAVDPEICGERDKASRHESKNRRKHREHKKKSRHNRSASDDEDSERKVEKRKKKRSRAHSEEDERRRRKKRRDEESGEDILKN
uniref:U11/U12 small nuclear ribonucleoprotein 35 kDa protein n=1 Tax=Lygus hesperus TaxID=30085 RepID=A0A0A9YDN1_LYGHE